MTQERSSVFQARNKVYDSIYSWIREHSERELFLYEGVDILKAYSESLYEPLSNIFIKKTSGEAVEELDVSSFSYRKKRDKVCLRFLALPIYIVLDLFRKISNYLMSTAKRDIIVYADLRKVEKINHLLRDRAIFIRDTLPESLVLASVFKRVYLKLFSDYHISAQEKRGAFAAAARIISALEAISSPLMIAGDDYLPYVKKYLMALWKEELPSILEMVKQMHNMLIETRAKSLLLDEDRTVSKNLFTQLARMHNCRSYVYCHGEPFEKIGYVPVEADHIFVWGQEQKNILKSWHVPDDKIIVSGCSGHEKYSNASCRFVKKKICRHLLLPYNKPIILVIPYPVHIRNTEDEKMVWLRNKAVIESAGSFKDVNIVIKLHPGDTYLPELRALVGSFKNKNIRVLKDYDSLLLAKCADVVIVNLSTLCIDCFAFKKPVILVDVLSWERYKDTGVFYDGTTAGKLEDALSGILNGKYDKHIINWREAADYLLAGVDGMASKRISQKLTENG